MSLSVGRREALAGAAAAGIALSPKQADASLSSLDTYKPINAGPGRFLMAPVVEIFDARGCDPKFSVGYNGPKAGDENDELCVKGEF